jgi:hypothetical protein
MLAVGSSEKLVPKYKTTRRHYTNTTIQILGVINILNLVTYSMCSFDEIHKVSRTPNFLNSLIQKVATSSWIMAVPTSTRIENISTRLVAVYTWLMATFKLHNGYLGLCFLRFCLVPLGECSGFRA